MRTDSDSLKGYDLVLDVAHPKGRAVAFFPCGMNPLRSEITFSMIPGKHKNPAISIIGGTLPGMRLYVDTKNRTCKIIDKLTLTESESIVEKLRQLSKTEDYINTSVPEKIRDNDFGIPKSEMPVWLYWIKRLVDEKKFKVVKGDVPATYYEIVESAGGKLEISDDNGMRPRNKDDKPFNVVTLEDFEYELEGTKKS